MTAPFTPETIYRDLQQLVKFVIELADERDELKEERDAAIKRAEEAEAKVKVLMAPHKSYDALCAETEKLRGELAAKDNRIDDDTATINRLRVELARADKAAFAAMADALKLEEQLATIAEKTAREQRQKIANEWRGYEDGKLVDLSEAIMRVPLVTDATGVSPRRSLGLLRR